MLRVLIFLDDPGHQHLRTGGESSWRIDSVSTVRDLLHACREDRADALISGPPQLGATVSNGVRVSRQIAANGGPPLVVFAPDTYQHLSYVIGLAVEGIRFEVAFWRVDGRTEGLRDAVRRAAISRLADRVATAVLELAPSLSAKWRSIVQNLFRRPADFIQTGHLVEPAGLTATALNHNLHTAGLRSFRVLRRASRVTSCYALQSRCSLSASQAARRVGYGSIDALDRDVRKIASKATPGTIVEKYDEAAFLALVITHCLHHECDQLVVGRVLPPGGWTTQVERTSLVRRGSHDS